MDGKGNSHSYKSRPLLKAKFDASDGTVHEAKLLRAVPNGSFHLNNNGITYEAQIGAEEYENITIVKEQGKIIQVVVIYYFSDNGGNSMSSITLTPTP